MAKDERIGEEGASATDGGDVEAHGAKKVVGTGLAAAALLGAGAAGVVKLAGDDDQRVAGALTARETDAVHEGQIEIESLKAADRDGDGYLTYRELAEGGFGKLNVDELNAEGVDVTADGLAAAGMKIEIDAVGKEGGFPVRDDTLFLRYGVDGKLDEMVKGSAAEWTDKFREIDRDGDGYAAYEELLEAGWKLNVDELTEAGYDVTPEGLAKAGVKLPLETFGEGGFVTKEDMVMLRLGVDQKVDALIKGERG